MTRDNRFLIDQLKVLLKKNVLIIDDCSKNRSAFQSQIRRLANVFTASNKQEALDAVNTNSIDVVFCDYQMHPDNGANILADIVALFPEIKRFALASVYSQECKMDFIENAKTNVFIQKPYDVNDVESKIYS